MTYYCKDCGKVFNQPVHVQDGFDYEFWGQRGFHDMSYEGCPECESDAIEECEESWKCVRCGEVSDDESVPCPLCGFGSTFVPVVILKNNEVWEVEE